MSQLEPLQFFAGANTFLFANALRAIPESEAGHRFTENTNSVRGLALHVTIARHGLCQQLGCDLEPLPWKDVGERFQAGFEEGGDQPSLAEILGRWESLTPALQQALVTVGEDVLAKPSPMSIPGVDRPTVEDFARLCMTHEAYHIGQLGLLAKAVSGTGIMQPQD